ncbi:MAG: alkaline phosphatase family protein [Acidimicrobiia bacterium]|nr:alkaline phosphatase family protein [Acidimicrobiia bacterium]
MSHYSAELVSVDHLVGYLVSALPPRAALVVTSDHGQIHVGDDLVHPHREILDHCSFQSGEGRFRWFHARPGHQRALHEAAVEHHEEQAWVMTREEMIAAGWFGPTVTPEAAARLGDVALVAKGSVAFVDPKDTGPFELVGRHGSLTPAEMLVPLLVS